MYFLRILGSSRRFSSSFNCPGNQLQHAGVNPITGGNKWLDYLLSPRLPKQRELRDPTSISFNAMQVSSGSFFSSNCAGSCAGSRSTSSTADPLVEGAAGVSEGSSECAKTSPALQVLQRSRPSYLNVLLILRNATLKNASEDWLNCTPTDLAQTFITKLLWFLQALFSPPIALVHALVHAPLLPLRTLLLKAPQGFQKAPQNVQRHHQRYKFCNGPAHHIWMSC